MSVASIVRRGLFEPVASAVREAYEKQHYPLGYAPGLDGLRGLMTIGIMLAHIRGALVPGAVAFMDVFYVMSGYFITALLVRDLDRHGRIRFGEFYRRRFSRLLPALVVMLAAYLTFRFFFYPPFEDAFVDASIAFLYLANWFRAFDLPGLNYMAHTWSLAMEEQFYLLWPILFLGLARWKGIGWRLVGIVLGFAFLIWMWRIWMTANGASWTRLYNGLDTRGDALLIGCALAVALRLTPTERLARFDPILKKLAWPIIVYAVLISAFGPGMSNALYYYAGITLLAALPGVVIVVLLIRPLNTPVHLVFERPELVFLGRIFYGMYLWHYPIFFIMKDLWKWPSGVRGLVGIPLVILVATLSYAFIERHFMRTRAPATRAVPVPG